MEVERLKAMSRDEIVAEIVALERQITALKADIYDRTVAIATLNVVLENLDQGKEQT